MSGAVLRGRRGLEPLAARPATLPGYRLVFTLPVGPGERGCASVEPEACRPFAWIAIDRQGEGAASTSDAQRSVYCKRQTRSGELQSRRTGPFKHRPRRVEGGAIHRPRRADPMPQHAEPTGILEREQRPGPHDGHRRHRLASNAI